MPDPPARGPSRHRRLGLVSGLIAATVTIATLQGPGLTIDEPLDVRPGRDYVTLLFRTGLRFFERSNVDGLFRDNAEHPPLGRWLLGIASHTFGPFQAWLLGPDPTGLYVVAGRVAPALCFAVLVGLIAAEAARRWGTVAGIASAWTLLAMPRVFAHAHLGALDTFISLFWTLALLTAARAIDARRPVLLMLVAGLAWGLALLTKIHAWFLPPLVLAWALVRLRPSRAIVAVAGWFVVGVVVFVAGWPWLWYDTASRWAAFWGTGVQRASIRVEYFGRIWTDRTLPWHYPWFYFAVTVPVLFHLMGIGGLIRAWRDRREDLFPGLLAASILLFLVLFSTRAPVYDGERLFLLTFPAWAMLAGLGFREAWERWGTSANVRRLLVVLMMCQAFGTLSMHPFGLSYYDLLVGGLSGAERLGLEPTYWGDVIDRVLLDDLAKRIQPGEKVALVPTLYPGQGVLTTTDRLVRKDVVIQDESEASRADWVLLSRRRAYWPEALVRRLEDGSGQMVASRSRQGVWLGALWHFPKRPNSSP